MPGSEVSSLNSRVQSRQVPRSRMSSLKPPSSVEPHASPALVIVHSGGGGGEGGGKGTGGADGGGDGGGGGDDGF